MEKEEATGGYRAHVLVLPHDIQSHINPIVQFSKRLASKRIKITVTTTLSTKRKMEEGEGAGDGACGWGSSSITLESIYDDCSSNTEGGAGGFKGFLDRFERSRSANLIQLVRNLESSAYPVKCLVYDANIPWASNVAKKLAIQGAAFFTQSCAAIASYYPMRYGCQVDPYPPSLVGLPPPRLPNLPSLGSTEAGRYPPIIVYILSQFDNVEKADWVLFNSFDILEEEVMKWMSRLWPVKTIGPTLPSFYLDKRFPNDTDYGLHLHKPSSGICIQWLDAREVGSVVYISFGSVAGLSAVQMGELAQALISDGGQTHRPFLWVVRPSEENKLPGGFLEQMAREPPEKGLVVKWSPQLQVLAHKAVGCFVSHCGWNSTIEALSMGVPLVAMPQFLDQMTNAHFVEKAWKVGVTAKVDEQGVASREEIRRCIEKIMASNGGGEMMMMKKNAARWKELAMQAVDEMGSSDRHIQDIVDQLCHKK